MISKPSFALVLGTIFGVSSTFVFAESASQTAVTNTLNQAQLMQQSTEQHAQLNKMSEDKWSEWGLNREDWTRYEEIMKGPRGKWTPNIDPLTALGVEANSEAERNRYAELLAKKESARAVKEFAFQLSYSRAFERLYPNVLPFRMDSTDTTTAAIGRIIYFTRTDCGQKCADNLTRLWSIAAGTAVDIYVVDSHQNDKTIQDWAIKNHIDIEKVKNRQITLNHDQGYWLRYAEGKMPAAFLIQGDGQWKPLVY